MGYYTSYSMVARRQDRKAIAPEDQQRIVDWLKEHRILHDVMDEGLYRDYDMECDFYTNEPAKWYECEYDMAALSEAFPDFVFKLHGEGEDPEDLWNAYFQNGESEECRAAVVYPEPKTIKW